jgi:exopolysaccharide biosynthesis WecB/TagA/CpsF family protein
MTSTTHGEHCPILGIPFSTLDRDGAVARIRAMLRDGGRHHLAIANAHTVNCAAVDPACHAALRRAALVLRDGVGVEVAGALRRRPMRHNFVGTDFVPYLLEQLASPEVRVFLFGGEPGVAERAASVLAARRAGIRIAGVQHGYGPDAATVQQIRATRPDVLLVALGNPRQERWIDRHLEAADVPLAIGVGALFDYLAGRLPRAPQWMRRARAEWVFRLAVEPRRLWRRYLVGNVQFLWRVLREPNGAGGGVA